MAERVRIERVEALRRDLLPLLCILMPCRQLNYSGGDIPDWLSGSYIRAGPGVFDVKDFTVNHWCDGFGVVYKFEIRRGKVLFSKRIIQSDAYKKAMTVGKPVFTELGTKAYTDTSKNIFQKMVSNVIPELTDNVHANIFELGNSVYLATESCYVRVLDTESLCSNKKVDISKYINVNRLCSHVYQDHDGTGFTLGSCYASNFKCQIIKFSENKTSKSDGFSNAQSICTVPNRLAKYSVYTHSFVLSDRFIVYIEQPFFINNMKLLTAHVKGRSLFECMEWNPEEAVRFVLIDKNTGGIHPILYEAENPFFFLHVVNCYEENNELVVDIICHDSPEIFKVLFVDVLRKFDLALKDQAACRRFILPLTDDVKCTPEGENVIKSDKRVSAIRQGEKFVIKGFTMTEPNYDLPTINNSLLGKKYTYFYATGLFGLSIYRGCIVKVNTCSGEVRTWKESNDTIPGEAAFVPRPGSIQEDDGVLVAGVTDCRPGRKDFLVVIDARDMTELARAETDAHVPHLLHAIFLPNS